MLSGLPGAAPPLAAPADAEDAPAAAGGDATATDTAAVPDARSMEWLRAVVGGRRIIVWCGERYYVIADAKVDSAGIWSANERTYRPLRKAFIQTPIVGMERVPPRPIEWSAVDSVAVVRSNWKRGAAIGLGVGVGAMIAVSPISRWYLAALTNSGRTPEVAIVVTLLAACALVGAAIGLPADHIERVYPLR